MSKMRLDGYFGRYLQPNEKRLLVFCFVVVLFLVLCLNSVTLIEAIISWQVVVGLRKVRLIINPKICATVPILHRSTLWLSLQPLFFGH